MRNTHAGVSWVKETEAASSMPKVEFRKCFENTQGANHQGFSLFGRKSSIGATGQVSHRTSQPFHHPRDRDNLDVRNERRINTVQTEFAGDRSNGMFRLGRQEVVPLVSDPSPYVFPRKQLFTDH
ncbi:hypothetical protein U8335_25050 [Roseiconus lacunae]|uniref:hypothetical protein n=1 Tax=Roseiconus lacunae TaxID=2605694 RepID=UPI00308756B8|nr:hypothetical protein U8335_25050 [Stieleria sp. HD01]